MQKHARKAKLGPSIAATGSLADLCEFFNESTLHAMAASCEPAPAIWLVQAWEHQTEPRLVLPLDARRP